MSRIASRFAELRRANRAAFIPFITAGDPDFETCLSILQQLPAAGADLIELGVPFSDPMADGPAIQAASLRALKAGATVDQALELVRRFRGADPATPLVLMGYFNPIHAYGVERFAADAAGAGVDGLITVDLPPEEDSILRRHAAPKGIDVIRLATPTGDRERLARILNGASGFLYYVSVAGVTGTKSCTEAELHRSVQRLKEVADIPCAVGFGVRSPEQAKEIARFADAVVVGSAIVERIARAAESGECAAAVGEQALAFCGTLADSVHAARPLPVLQELP